MKISVPVFTHARAAIWYLSTKMKRAVFVGNIINSVRIAGRGLSGRTDMQELEKILEEIDETIERYGENPYIDEKVTDLCYGLNQAKRIIRNHMTGGWIPVEDRLPKVNTTYNVTRYIDGHFISDSAYFDGQNTWHSDNRVNHARPYLADVIAWRPLPEPYRPKVTKP